VTTKSKKPTNGDQEVKSEEDPLAGEFDLAAEAAPVSPSTADEVDLLKYQVRDDYDGQDAAAPREMTKFLVGSPHPQMQVFAHPEYHGAFHLLKLNLNGQTYIVIDRALRDERVRAFTQLKELFPLCTLLGGILIWVVPAPRPDSPSANNSNESANEVVAIARHKLVTIRWDREVNMWTCAPVLNAEHLSFKELCPAFFEMSFNTMLNKAFKGRILTDPDHPILQSLYDAKVAQEFGRRRK
jgi:hypothetical protein